MHFFEDLRNKRERNATLQTYKTIHNPHFAAKLKKTTEANLNWNLLCNCEAIETIEKLEEM